MDARTRAKLEMRISRAGRSRIPREIRDKSVADFGVLARDLVRAIDQLDVTEHMREIMRTIVSWPNSSLTKTCFPGAHTRLPSHVISKSRQFSTTMTALRERRAAWRKEKPRRRSGSDYARRFESTNAVGIRAVGPHQPGRSRPRSVRIRPAQQQRFTARDALREGA